VRQIVSYILLLFYLFVINIPALPIINYTINYKYISEELCENKDKPEMQCHGQCHGKCHLKKEIKKVLGDNNSPLPKKTNIPELKIKEYTNYYRKSIVVAYIYKLTFPNKKYTDQTIQTSSGHLPILLKPPPSSFI